jgi:hypothetical protein
MKKNCPKSGIKIHESNNNSNHNFTKDFVCTNQIVEPRISTLNIDLDIDNYSCEDLFILLGIQGRDLDDDLMKNVKKIVLKTHPDKSKLPSDYYIFFSKAYNRLHSIYIIQNKSTKKIDFSNTNYATNQTDEKSNLLNFFFDNNAKFKDPKTFNKWFNNKFDKHNIKEDEHGHGDWLKSNEGIFEINEGISQSQINGEMEKIKQRTQSIIPYQGIQDTFSTSSVVSSDNFSDLKQAYEESVIPVSEQDYNKIKKFKTVDEYISYRDDSHKNTHPMSKINANNELNSQRRKLDKQCIAMAYDNIKKNDKHNEQNNLFWSDLKRLT